MNLIKCEKLEKSMAELQFSIDAEAFKKAVADVFKKEGKKYAVPGFRKGKAPRALIEKMYGADVFTYDAINELFPAAYEAAVKEAGIEPVGRPEVSVDAASETEGVTLTVKVAVMPEVKVGNYNGLTVEKTVHTVTDEAVDAELKRVQERNARELTREGAAQNGDIADIDFEGFVDGVAFEGGKAEHYSLTLGSGSFIPGFEDQIVGHSAGEEFDVNVTFPTEYQAAELAGKEAVFKINNIPFLLLSLSRYEDVENAIQVLADSTGHHEKGIKVVTAIRERMAITEKKMPDKGLTCAILHGTARTLTFEGEETIAGETAKRLHISNVFADGELDEKSNVQILHIASSRCKICNSSIKTKNAPGATNTEGVQISGSPRRGHRTLDTAIIPLLGGLVKVYPKGGIFYGKNEGTLCRLLA